jgi:hypothetical protein
VLDRIVVRQREGDVGVLRVRLTVEDTAADSSRWKEAA